MQFKRFACISSNGLDLKVSLIFKDSLSLHGSPYPGPERDAALFDIALRCGGPPHLLDRGLESKTSIVAAVVGASHVGDMCSDTVDQWVQVW